MRIAHNVAFGYKLVRGQIIYTLSELKTRWSFYRSAAKTRDLLTKEAIDPKVQSGPFTGMCYLNKAHGSVLAAKIEGTYEAEVAWCVEHLVRHVNEEKISKIVVLGSAEGYYSVGLLRRCESVKVVAYDTSEIAQKLTKELATINKVVDRLEVYGTATAESLSRYLTEKIVVVCDIEGAEKALLARIPTAQLTESWFLIETHDIFEPDTTRVLIEKFAEFSNVIQIYTKRAKSDESEHRPGNASWLFVYPGGAKL